jgi:hypothetical protein
MRAILDFTPGRLELNFERDSTDDERIEGLRYSMNDTTIYFNLPEELSEIHPDLLGLATILLCNQFTGDYLQLPRPISRRFYEMASGVISRYKLVEDIDEDIEPIGVNSNGRPGLCFSGGVDSSAALAILPARTVPVFLNRPLEQDSLYDSHAPLAICKMIAQSGYDVNIVNSNLEHIRNPLGFPTDLANAIPCLLLSQYLELDSIAFGTILESAYGIGHEHFIDYGKGSHWKFYGTLFSAVGVELNLPTIGISEVGTAMIGMSSPIASLGQSCIRGSWKKPCNRCWKCFRKEMLNFAIDENLGSPEFWRMLDVNEIQVRLSAFPISHENVIAYSMQRIELERHPSLKPIAAKLDMNKNLGFLEKWYSDSIEFVPDKYRNYVRSKILDFLEPATFEEEMEVKSWDMNPHLASTMAIRAQDRLISYWQDLN